MSPMSSGLRVASWNVREGLPHPSTDPLDRPAALGSLAALVIEQGIDVLAMQEVDHDVIGRSAVLTTLRAETDLQYVHAVPLSPSSFLPGYRSGLAIASRVPIAGRVLERLPNPDLAVGEMRSYDKGALAGTVSVGELRVTVVSVHAFPFRRFGHTPEETRFAPVWQALADLLGKLDDPLVVCGDFNTPRRDLLTGRTDRPLARAIGDRPTHRGQPTDDILYSADLVPAAEPRVLRGFSDHDLCVVTLLPS
jgi:endonuclease/exonuclease/phosphatase family metal-dependent hydrolase